MTLRWVPWVNLLAWCGMYGVVGIFHWWIGPRPVNQSEALPERLGERLSVSRESSFRIRGQPAAAQFAPEAEIWTATAALTPALTILLVPTWWSDPWRGIAIFLWSNLTRQRTTWIPTQFFGTLYEFSLPWYNTLAWVFLTVPPLTLLLIVCGTVATIFCRTKMPTAVDEKEILESNPYFARLLLLNAATLLVIRALPGAPGHDGERQLLGSFPFLACLAGFGVECMRNIVQSRWKLTRANTVLRGFAALALVWATFDTWRYRPVQLSYYTELVGGLRGAARIGLEPTYYWDALDHNVIDWLNQHTRPGEKVLFCNYAQDSFRYLDQWGTLRASIWPHEPGVWRWYVLQNRPGLFAEKPWDRWLAEHGRPAFTREQDRVPLLWVFPIEEYEKARRQTEPARQAD